MKKIVYITTFIIVLLITVLSVTYSYEYNDTESLVFELIGSSKLYVDVNSEYKEYGIKVIKNGVDISSSVRIDNSSVNMKEPGEYKVKYELDVDGNIEYIYRDVKVVDMSAPSIKLKGDSVIYVLLGGSYIEEGYTVIDNYEIDIDVNVIGNVDTNKEGEYEIEYKATDSSGNIGRVKRFVVVKKSE